MQDKLTFGKVKIGLTTLAIGCGSYFLISAIIGIAAPFVVAIVLAYLFEPFVFYCETKLSVRRSISSFVIVTSLFTIIVILCVTLAPILYTQFISLLTSVPLYLDFVQNTFIPILSKFMKDSLGGEYYGISLNETFRTELNSRVNGFSGHLFQIIFRSGVSTATTISLILLTPILCYYIMHDFNKIKSKLKSLVPIRYGSSFDNITREIRFGISSYIKGQLYILVFQSFFYSVGLAFTGLNYSLLIGVCTGVFSIIPYIGVTMWTVIGVAVSIFQFHAFYSSCIVLSVFITGQIVEAYFLTPKIIGGKIGLHPVWIIFGFLSLGSIFGFFGILFAVPITVVMSIIIKHSIQIYKESDYYKLYIHKKRMSNQ